MSTRGCVAVGIPLKWMGVFNHCDSHPFRLGKEVWHYASDSRNLALLCEEILRAGRWENFVGNGDGLLEPDIVTSDNPDPLFIEWVYVIDPDRSMLHVLCNRIVADDWSKPRITPPAMRPGGIVDYGHCACRHILAASVDLGGPGPDWVAISHEKYDGEGEEG
jgi:hypothetical protein